MALQLWKNREQKKLDPELFSVKAEEFARKINDESTRTINKGTQLRKFFDEILRLNTLAQAKDADWNLILPQVHMVIAKTAYAQGGNWFPRVLSTMYGRESSRLRTLRIYEFFPITWKRL